MGVCLCSLEPETSICWGTRAAQPSLTVSFVSQASWGKCSASLSIKSEGPSGSEEWETLHGKHLVHGEQLRHGNYYCRQKCINLLINFKFSGFFVCKSTAAIFIWQKNFPRSPNHNQRDAYASLTEFLFKVIYAYLSLLLSTGWR